MTIGHKLYSGFGVALFLTIIMGSVAIHNVDALGDEITNMGKVKSNNLYLAGDINKLTSDMLGAVRGMNLRAHLNEADFTQKLYEQIKIDSARIQKEGSDFALNSTAPGLKEKMQTQVLDKQPDFNQLVEQDYDLIKKNDLLAADKFFLDKVFPVANSISNDADNISQSEYQFVVSYADQAVAAVAPARYLSLGIMLLALLVGASIIWVVRGINGILHSSIVELNDGANQVATAAGQVSSSSQSLAQGASEQAASLEETSASSEEINSMARKNTDNSRSTADLLARSQEKVNQANRYLEDMVVSMDLITDSSGKISKIIKVIDEIAFQTNILALNAAVEAARAGEAGMGFAVVADEVRSLAQRSAQAAKDTAILIEDSITRSNEGKVKVDQVAVAIRAVTEDSAKVKVMVDEVSLGSEEQSRGIEQIGRAISQMEQVTQTNAASAEEGAAAAEELSAQSETLKDIISRLHEMVGGSSQGTSLSLRSSRRSSGTFPVHRPHVTSLARTFSSKPTGLVNPNRTSQENLKSSTDELASFPLEESFQSF